MSTDADDADGPSSRRMTKIDVRVPQDLLDTIDAEYEERGYTSRSEAIRDALRTWVDPPVRLSEDLLDDLANSREQANSGDTHEAEDVRDRLGLDDG